MVNSWGTLLRASGPRICSRPIQPSSSMRLNQLWTISRLPWISIHGWIIERKICSRDIHVPVRDGNQMETLIPQEASREEWARGDTGVKLRWSL